MCTQYRDELSVLGSHLSHEEARQKGPRPSSIRYKKSGLMSLKSCVLHKANISIVNSFH